MPIAILPALNIWDYSPQINTFILCIVVFLMVRFFGFSRDNRNKVIEFFKRDKPVIDQAIDIKNQLTLLEYVPVAMILCDENMNIIMVNQMTSKMMLWEASEMIGRNVLMFIPDRYQKSHLDGLRFFKLRRTGAIINTTVEIFSLIKGGFEIPIELTVELKVDNGKDYFIATIRDMSLIKQKIDKLQGQLDFYTEAEKLIHTGFFNCDYVNNKVLMSENMLAIFDKSGDENNCPIEETTDCLISTDRERVGEAVTKAITEGKGYEIEYTLKNGRHIKTVAGLQFNKYGKATNIIGALRIIS